MLGLAPQRLEREVVAVVTQHLLPLLDPVDAGLAHPEPFGGERRLLGVEAVREQVHADPPAERRHLDHARELRAEHQREPAWSHRHGLGPAAGGVVIGQRENVETGPGGACHDR